MIRVGIYGYGNLGRGVEIALQKRNDMQLVAVFTRRDPKILKTIDSKILVVSCKDVLDYVDKIDVMVLCGGSATDLPVQTPQLAKYFNVIDSFDTHVDINKHFDNVNKVAINNAKVGIVSIGWDPGLFSLSRVYADFILIDSTTYTFWGDGVSQGHSDAIRRIPGVKYATQYTRPIIEAVNKVRDGLSPKFVTKDMHLRDCYVVIENGFKEKKVAKKIKEMPKYFADYNTLVTFIDEEEYFKNHTDMPHGGYVISSSLDDGKHLIEYSLKTQSNPEFTALVLVAYTQACYRLYKEKNYGAKTIYDIAPSYISSLDSETLRKKYL